MSVLTGEQKQFFLDNGYLVLRQAAPEEALSVIQQVLVKWSNRVINRWIKKGLIESDYAALPYQTRLCMAWMAAGKPHCNDMLLNEIISADVFRFMNTPLFIQVAKELLGADRLLTWKGFHGRAKLTNLPTTIDTPWHQDGQYLPASNPFVVLWIPLVDVSEENSCLVAAAGHHKKGLQENHKFAGGCSFHESFIKQLDNLTPVTMQRGDLLFMHHLLPHAALPNRSESVRWSFDMRFEKLTPQEPAPLGRGFISAHEDPSQVETSFERCRSRLWSDIADWR